MVFENFEKRLCAFVSFKIHSFAHSKLINPGIDSSVLPFTCGGGIG